MCRTRHMCRYSNTHHVRMQASRLAHEAGSAVLDREMAIGGYGRPVEYSTGYTALGTATLPANAAAPAHRGAPDTTVGPSSIHPRENADWWPATAELGAPSAKLSPGQAPLGSRLRTGSRSGTVGGALDRHRRMSSSNLGVKSFISFPACRSKATAIYESDLLAGAAKKSAQLPEDLSDQPAR